MIKLGIIGYGKIGSKHHQVFDALGAKVITSCNRSEAGRQRAKEAGIPNTYSSFHEMLKKEKLDGVVCATSLFNNQQVAKEIIPYQIPILLEKPPGTSLVELEELISLQEQHKTLVMLATNRIWYSVLHKAIEDIGGLDQIEGVQVMWSENPQRLKEKRGFTDEQIRTRNFTNSIHGFSILHFLCGELSDYHVAGLQGDGFYRWNMSLQGVSNRGVVGQFTSSWSSILPWRLSFYGQNKIYDFAPLEQCTCTDLTNRTKKQILGEAFDKDFKPGFYLQGKAFIDAIQNGNLISSATLQEGRYLFNYAEAVTKKLLSKSVNSSIS